MKQRLYYVDPVSHSFEALAGARFADMSRPSLVNHSIAVPIGLQTYQMDALEFLVRAATHSACVRTVCAWSLD